MASISNLQSFHPSCSSAETVHSISSSLLIHPKLAFAENYNSVMINVPTHMRFDLENKLNHLVNESEILQNLQDLLNTGIILNPSTGKAMELFQNKDLPLYALKAFQLGLIDCMAFTTSQIFYNTIAENPENLEEIPLFIDDAPNPTAWNYIKTTSKRYSCFPSDWLTKKAKYNPLSYSYLTDQQIQDFFDLVKPLPALQRRFLIFKDLYPLKSTHQKSPSIAQKIGSMGFNPLQKIYLNHHPFRIASSKAMLQAYCLAISHEQAPLLQTQFLLSSLDWLHQGMQDRRPLAIHFSALPKIEEADEFPCTHSLDVSTHDFYHALTLLHIPKQERLKLFGFANLLEKIINDDSFPKEPVNELFAIICDMEHKLYSPFYSSFVPSELRFWLTICDSAIVAANYQADKKNLSDVQPERIIQLQLLQTLCKIISENTESYKRDFGINLDDFLNHPFAKNSTAHQINPEWMIFFEQFQTSVQHILTQSP